MTPLAQVLCRRIAATGPITLAEYMTDCLLHPDHGYYMSGDPLGAAGDFTTAPEISQMFGELVGLAMVQAWIDQGRPAPFTLAELGPGRGTLMADILRVARAVPGFLQAGDVFLVEASPVLQAKQKDNLGARANWVDRANLLPDQPLFLVANEFFDALPIRQFTRHAHGWCEHLVGLKEGNLSLGLGTPTPYGALDFRLEDTKPGDIVETCAPAAPVLAEIANRISAHGGGALIFDYGDWRSQGDTLQAIARHSFVDAFAAPGQADLTAHVDFEALVLAAPNLTHTKLTRMGVFLERLGIAQRAETLAQGLTGRALDAHIAAHRRLTHPDEMGTLFKVLGFTQTGAPSLAGFET